MRTMLKLGLVAAGVVSWLAQALAAEPQRARARATDDAALARQYVLAACLIKRYPNSPIAQEAETWAGGLVEHGNVPAEIYPKLAEIAEKRALPPQQSKSGMPMILQSCLQLYDSPALRTEIGRLLRRR
jgi:hypothetical protein